MREIATSLPDDLPLCPMDLNALALYMNMLDRWNKSINLVGRAGRGEILRDLICDSFHLAHFIQSLYPFRSGPVIWDPGAGAGLPGIPLRMVWTDGTYTMIEVREKRALFLDNVLCRLKLLRTKVFHGTVEKFADSTPPELHPDCILSRAFKPWQEMLSLCGPMLKPGGNLIILANCPPPQDVTCRLIAARSYQTGHSERWFWALRPLAAS